MKPVFNTVSLLQSTDTEFEHLELMSISQEGDTTICHVATRFLEEEYGDEEEEYDVLVSWNSELKTFTVEMCIVLGIDPEGYGWTLDELNTRSADERWVLQARLECPDIDEEPQQLALVGSWKLGVSDSFLKAVGGPQAIGIVLREMLQVTCMDTVLLAIQLTDDYAELQKM